MSKGTSLNVFVTIPGTPETVVPAFLKAIQEAFAETPNFHSVKADATVTFRKLDA